MELGLRAHLTPAAVMIVSTLSQGLGKQVTIDLGILLLCIWYSDLHTVSDYYESLDNYYCQELTFTEHILCTKHFVKHFNGFLFCFLTVTL